MKSKQFVSWTIAAVSSLVLAGLVTAATLKSPTAALAAGGNDPTDGNITRVTASLLEHSQFSHHQLDNELAKKFLGRYLDSLDPAHLLFLQSDAQEFDGFCPRLAHTFDPGALKVTIQKFYRPSGASTQLKGVKADIALPSLSNVADVGEAKLQDPLPWDRKAATASSNVQLPTLHPHAADMISPDQLLADGFQFQPSL